MTGTDGRALEPKEVWNGVLRDIREVEVRDSTIVITHRLTSTSSDALEYLLIDPFPAEFDIDEIGFHPDYEPAQGRLGGDRAVISGVVGPDEEVVVKYGIRPQRSQLVEEVERRQRSAEPSIELSTSFEVDEDEELDLEAATQTRSSSGADFGDPDSPEFIERMRRRVEAMRASTSEGQPEGAEGDIVEATDESEGEEPTLQEVLDVGEPDPEEPEGEPQPGVGIGGDPFGGSESDASLASAASPRSEDPGPDDPSGAPPGDAEADGPEVVEELIAALTTGSVTEDQQRRLGGALLGVIDAAEPDRPSRDARLRHLEAELQRFEAYTAAIEDLLDEHGPAGEFLAELRSDLESLDDDIESLEQEFEQAATSRSSQLKWLDMLADEVSSIDSRQNRLGDRVESLEGSLRSKTAGLESRIAELEPAVEETRGLRDDMEELQASVAELEERLSTLGSILSGTDVE